MQEIIFMKVGMEWKVFLRRHTEDVVREPFTDLKTVRSIENIHVFETGNHIDHIAAQPNNIQFKFLELPPVAVTEYKSFV